MPLLKIFTSNALKVSASSLHQRLQKIWNVPGDVLKVLVLPSLDMSGDEDLYIDVRAKAKPERTQDAIDNVMKEMQSLFAEHGYNTNIRVELYSPDLQSSLKST
mmetsp:Transcript_3415/g.5098  ORF Transcript_3415/g.5098 Transcript_3415/m.5098 type:complete len:104 (+) Transcript_3415:98-409(+)|eukprot:CAMPEP_0194212408 /NCGR_PEP_ID=MMETSP0156-20130528/12237_1 /TAXON_ID=33649 /ORGANISM="Thalassionema nitzschioides, Strain L26-B" /LENGTH=103 /DNA_ID=CAMNT_0038940221 /DNA_START=24 /DNA_END=335 /DNA_ORIENTATION=+